MMSEGGRESRLVTYQCGAGCSPACRVCDERPERGGAELAALLPSIPKDKLMIETDAPYLVRGSVATSVAP